MSRPTCGRCVYQRRVMVYCLHASVAAHKDDDDDHITSTLDGQQQNDLKKVDETAGEIIEGEGDVGELHSAFSDHDHLSVVDTKLQDTMTCDGKQ